MAKPEPASILLVEDDPFLLKIMGYYLSREFNLDRAHDGAEALNKIRQNKYAVVLLDLVMPVKDGFTVLKELKKEKVDTPVLVFSNLSQNQEKKQALALGAEGYFVKSDMAITDVTKIVEKFIRKPRRGRASK